MNSVVLYICLYDNLHCCGNDSLAHNINAFRTCQCCLLSSRILGVEDNNN